MYSTSYGFLIGSYSAPTLARLLLLILKCPFPPISTLSTFLELIPLFLAIFVLVIVLDRLFVANVGHLRA